MLHFLAAPSYGEAEKLLPGSSENTGSFEGSSAETHPRIQSQPLQHQGTHKTVCSVLRTQRKMALASLEELYWVPISPHHLSTPQQPNSHDVPGFSKLSACSVPGHLMRSTPVIVTMNGSCDRGVSLSVERLPSPAHVFNIM